MASLLEYIALNNNKTLTDSYMTRTKDEVKLDASQRQQIHCTIWFYLYTYSQLFSKHQPLKNEKTPHFVLNFLV